MFFIIWFLFSLVRAEDCNEKDREQFFNEADFGYIDNQIDSLTTICKARSASEGFLKCSEYLQFCQAKDLWIDFRDLAQRKQEVLRYKNDVLKRGQMAAKCQFDQIKLKREMINFGVLQTWAAEMQNFQAFQDDQVPVCDVT